VADPLGAPPAAAPPRSSNSPRGLSLLLVGAIVGGIAGGVAGGAVARRDGGGIAPVTATAAPAPLPPAPSPPASAQDPSAVAAVAEALSPSVVTVVNLLADGRTLGSGSGFVVDAERGYVVTNSHVVSDARGTGSGDAFEVIFPDSRRVDARLVGQDPDTDVAVLEIGRQEVPALTLGDSDAVPSGATVVAIGSSLGEFRNSVTAGVVSGKGRRLPSELRRDIFLEDLIQTDAAISPGNSGGPLIWVATRQVIGVNTLVLREPGSEGLGFAVSSNTVRTIADELIRAGRVERGRIGIVYESFTGRQAPSLGLPAGATGIVVTEVVPGSPGAGAGIRPGDVITKVNEQRIDLEHPLLTIMLRFRPGDRVSLTIVRNGREQVTDVVLGRP